MSKHTSSSPRKTSRSSIQKKRAEEAAPFLDGIRYIMDLKGFKETARNIFDQCKKIVGADGGYIGLLSEDGREMRLLFLDPGRRPCTVDAGRPMPIRGLREQAVRSRKAVFCNDFPASEWQGILPEGHVRLDNILFAPVIIQGKVVGLLGLGNKPGGFDKQDVRIITTFADMAAISLHNSQTLEALERSEERFHAVAQSATDAVISINQHGDVVFWNVAAQTIFGWEADEMIGKPLKRIYPERFRADHRAGVERVASMGESHLIGKTTECIGLRRDGIEFPIELSLSKWQTHEGTFFTGIVRDITKRKRAEEEYRTIINTAMDGFWITDMQGRFLDMNDAYCHLIGYSREELLKMGVQDVEAAEKPEETGRHIQKVIEAGYDRFETLHRCKDGRVIAVEASANYIPGEGGRFFVFLRDITARKQIEEALQKAHDEL
jgi:PAS domain S-box-containing protein